MSPGFPIQEPRRRWARIKADGAPARSLYKIWGKRSIRLLFLLALALLALALPLACATVITPPPHPADPVTVYLLDHGRTSSLLLPTPDGALWRYAYGNWEWYALKRQSLRSGLRALIWPSPAALGRHRYPGPADPASVEQTYAPWCQHIYPITVSRGRLTALEDRLDRRYQASAATLQANTDYELEFVRDPQPYDLFHDSNHVVAGWLRELGCRVRGPAVYSRWRVEPHE